MPSTLGPAFIVTADCPLCHKPLVLRESKHGVRFAACSGFPRCQYRSSYDEVLHRLRDENARLRAEVTLFQMQQKAGPAVAESLATVAERKRHLTPWADVAPRWTPQPALDAREGR
jgi:ssDNA-binding Zn-finger/Zn-ribbon topoisomerase 1